MSVLRQRKLKDETAAPPPPSRRASSPRSLKKVFLCLVVFALSLTYIMGMLTSSMQVLDTIAKGLGYESVMHHAVIIDAGSSGSRVLAYKFRVPFALFNHGGLDLVEEYFEQSKPGLSSYADEPEQGAQTILKLIQSAEHLIPIHKRSTTPLIVRATAGLRLLPTEKANQLIEHVRQAIDRLGYHVSADAVQVMEGSDEGIFIWYTVNLLHDTMRGTSMAALDLGGGSTQITYRINKLDAVEVPAVDHHLVLHGEHNISVYTHSYLNLGLLAARYGIFRMEAGDAKTTDFKSVCVDPIVQNEPWVYANKQYYISGAPRNSHMTKGQILERCHELVKKYILATLDWEPKHPPRGNVAAMSYFYDIAADAGIIDVMKGGSVKVSQYSTAAMGACSDSNVEQPWACLDLLYVATLLHDAYKIDYDQSISLFKKVDGHEVSWALGLAYTTVLEMIQKSSPAR